MIAPLHIYGMITAQFGSKKFEVSNKKIYTPNGVSFSEEINIEETEVSGKKPTVTIKGIKLMPLDFEVKLDARFVDIDAEIQFWKKTLNAKKPYPFKLGKYTIGTFYLTKYNVAETAINRQGVYTSAKLSLSFTEAPANSKKKSSGGTTTTTPTTKKVEAVKASGGVPAKGKSSSKISRVAVV